MSGGKIVLLTTISILLLFAGDDSAIVAQQGGAVDWFRATAAGFVTFWSLSFFIFWGIVLAICIYNGSLRDRYWVTGALFAIIFVSFLLLGLIAPFVWIVENPFWATVYIGGYFLIATGWMSFRWAKFIEKVRKGRAVEIASFLKTEFKEVVYDHKLGRSKDKKDLNEFEIPAEEQDWYSEVACFGVGPDEPKYLNVALSNYLGPDLGSATSAPLFKENKSKFFTYFFYWPLDALIYIFGELLQDIWEFIVRVVQGIFDKYGSSRIRQKINLD